MKKEKCKSGYTILKSVPFYQNTSVALIRIYMAKREKFQIGFLSEFTPFAKFYETDDELAADEYFRLRLYK